MNIQTFFDQGSAFFTEDTIVYQPPCYYGVVDGESGVYLPSEGPKLFGRRTGGQVAAHAVSFAFEGASFGESLEAVLRKANNMIREISEKSGLSLQESELLPSVSFIVAKVTDENITILQGGDSLAVWQKRDGTIGGTPNKVFRYEKELLRKVTKLMEKHKGDREKMWEEYRPFLMAKRRANTNTTFALLNGQVEIERFWQKFSLLREEVRLLVLFSDGLVPFEWTKDEVVLGKKVIELYRKGGLNSILAATRVIAEQEKSSSHEDFPEATGVVIEF